MKKLSAKIKTFFAGSKHILLAVCLCFAAVILTSCFFVYAVSYEKILPNVKVEGLDIGGMEKADAEKELRSAFSLDGLVGNIVFECDGNEKNIDYEQLKVLVDENKTVQKAFEVGRQGGKIKKAARLLLAAFKETELPLEISVDTEKLEEIISELAFGKEIEPESAGYLIDGNQLTLKKGHGGKKVDRQKVLENVKKCITSGKTNKIMLAVEEIQAEKADAGKLYDELTTPAKDAQYKYEDGEVKIIDEKVRVIVEKQKIKEALEGSTEGMTLTVETELPKVTAAQLKELLFRDKLGVYSSNFSTSTAARASNVILTAQRINGYVLMPGDVFSYDKAVGRRTIANGYKEAGVYIGNKVESGIGGGICQTSSTLYSAALYANLEIVTRTSHSLPVSYVPAGQDATIAEGYIDLKIKNNTDYPVKIVAEVHGRNITCSILGVKPQGQTVELVHTRYASYEPEIEREADETIPKGYKMVGNKGSLGYAVSSRRILKQDGKIIKDEKLTNSIYRASNIIEKVNPADLNAPVDALKIYVPGMEIPNEQSPAHTETDEEAISNEEQIQSEEQPLDEDLTEEDKKEFQNQQSTEEL